MSEIDRALNFTSVVRLQDGSASVEYTLVTAAVIAILFVPAADLGGESAIGYLLEALRDFQRNTTYLISLP